VADEETKQLIITQPKSGAFAIAGSACHDPLRHRHEVGGAVAHSTPPGKPLVHMLLWDEDCACEVRGRITVAGDAEAPVTLRHHFPDDHHQTHVVSTALSDPIHHALQMRTPLQVRFCNSWQIASDYRVDVDVAGRRWMSIRLTGATIATPQPCPDEPCPPAGAKQPPHP
jgi:hypothetical protein